MTKIRACAAFLLLMVTVCVAADTATRKAQMPQITSNGRIVSGAKSIWQKPAYGDFVICIDNDAIGSMYEMFNFGKSDIRPVFFMNINQEQSALEAG